MREIMFRGMSHNGWLYGDLIHKYDDSNGAFVAVPYSDDDFSVPRYLVKSWIFKFRKRIIGNIYDNKDLMKEETK